MNKIKKGLKYLTAATILGLGLVAGTGCSRVVDYSRGIELKADFNNDGLIDRCQARKKFTDNCLFPSKDLEAYVLVYINNGDGSFDKNKYVLGESFSRFFYDDQRGIGNVLELTHINKDENLDIYAFVDGKSCVLLGNGDGTFGEPIKEQ